MSAGIVLTIIRRLWIVWNIRGFMILSLTMQLVLGLTAPLRMKTSNFIVILIVWLAYFLADWTAIFAFGLISNAGCSKSPSYMEVTGDLLALWASFLLIHLGGPDTITAFSLEDNSLWLRHLVGLIAQVFAFLYIFVKTLPDNKLMAPVILVFSTGVIKYGERTRALYLASLKNHKKSSIKSLNQPHHFNLGCFPLDFQEEMVTSANHFFHNIKGLIVNIMPNHLQWLESRDFFLEMHAPSVFKIIEIELNLLYEALYTKIIAVNSSWGVYIRNIAYYMSVAALILFCLNKKDGLRAVDIRITYALLVGVIALDASSEIMLMNASNISKRQNMRKLILGRCIIPFLITELIYYIIISTLHFCRCGFVIERLWSSKMGSFNLLVYSFEEGRPRKGCTLERCCRAIFGPVSEMIGIAEEIAKMRHTSKIGMIDGIWEYTFGILHRRASGADEPNKVREIYEARGKLSLRDSSDQLKRYVTEFEYDQSILLWHIATEICYNTDRNLNKDNENIKFSKILSDYVIYLMVKQPDMMLPVVDIFHKRYQDTCGKLKHLEQSVKAVTLGEFCLKVLEKYGGGIKPAHQDGNAGASALIDSCSLAMPAHEDGKAGASALIDSCSLAMLLAQTEMKWEIICTVWVELLSYAAGHCRVDSHGRLLSEGGEFVTFVWLLMAHFGIGPRFPKN